MMTLKISGKAKGKYIERYVRPYQECVRNEQVRTVKEDIAKVFKSYGVEETEIEFLLKEEYEE